MPAREIASKFMKAETAAWLDGNVNALDEVDAPDVVYHLMPPAGDIKGSETHKQYLATARKAFTDIKMDWKYLTGDDNIFAEFVPSR
jgi:hypothetical protein